MSRLSFFFKRLVRMDWKAMWKTTKILKERSGKSRLWLLCDMLRCALKYNAGYVDYKIAEMYRLTDEQKKTQITRGLSNTIVRRMNDKAYWYLFDDKATFNRLFKDEVNRDWIELSDELSLEDWKAFLDRNDDLICKPLEGSSGVGIERHTKEEWRGREEAFLQELREKKIGIVEERVIQHPKMAEMCPTSVNTIRVATLLGDKKEGIVYAYIRIGNGKVMDNVDCGGMAAPINLDTGVISGVGANKAGEAFEFHPMTGKRIPGTQIPYWEEVKAMCLKAMHVVPQVRFVAWDVAITPDGPVFIEGNSFPSHAIPQFAAHFPDGVGILPRFEAFIDL